MKLAPGTRLGPYEILGPLGAGAMGEVYRARDPRLDREVAVKVLPRDLAADPERMRRFTLEARAAGSLQHPNIVTVFDVGSADGIAYVVQELVPSGTLRERLAQGALSTREALRIAAGIAAGLGAAHEKGIVHRDLKPANVALAADGRPQILDFGLARVARPGDDATIGVDSTSAGMMIGTVGYMAPEQVRGEPSDHRADLFALGVILHEMLSGARPFARGSAVETMHAVLTEETPPLPPSVAAPVARVVARCLEKDKGLRFQSARDLGFTLELLGAEGSRAGGPGPAAGPAAPARRAAPVLLAALAVVLAAAGFLAGRMTSPHSGQGSIRVSTLSQGSRDSEPAVSPDGRMIAFNAVRQNGQGLWLMDLVTRSEVKLTGDADRSARFTADGGTLLFTRTENGRQSLWRIPVIGGKARLVLEGAGDADPSPDGGRIAYILGTGDSAGVRVRLMVAKSDGTGGRELWSSGSVTLATPRWSPDGRRIAVATSASQNAPNSIVVVDAASGSARKFPAPNGAVLSNPVWDGTGNGLIVAEGVGVTAVQRGASGRLFRLDAGSGQYRPLGWLENFPSIIALLPDGRLVLSSLLARQNLCEVAIGAPNLTEGRWLTSGLATDRQPVYSPDGKWVMFSSNRGGTLDLWEVSVETGEMHRVTDDPEDDWDPEYGPDGETIYWCSGRSGAFEIWTARRDGSAPRQVSRDSLDAENPSVTPDGKWVLYSSAHPAKSGLWRVPVAGGEGEWLLRNATLIPDLSPDGRYVSIITEVGTIGARLRVFDLAEKRLLPESVPLMVLPGTVQIGRSRFTPDGSAVAYLHAREDGQPILVRRPLSAWRTGAGRVDTLFAGTSDAIESFGFSPDGRRAAVSVVDWLSGLTIAEGVQGVVPPKRSR